MRERASIGIGKILFVMMGKGRNRGRSSNIVALARGAAKPADIPLPPSRLRAEPPRALA
jgi:hypothetical protein